MKLIIVFRDIYFVSFPKKELEFLTNLSSHKCTILKAMTLKSTERNETMEKKTCIKKRQIKRKRMRRCICKRKR
jgi:hypothetical protein